MEGKKKKGKKLERTICFEGILEARRTNIVLILNE